MFEANQSQVINAAVLDPHWKDLYRLGAIACILLAAAIPLAILAYFIWPYSQASVP